MTATRKNPIGSPAPRNVTVVRVGIGKQTHVFHPHSRTVICNSGKNAGRVSASGKDNRGKPQTYFKSEANFVTCYRCQKLMALNLEEGRAGWMAPRDRF